MVTEFSDQKGDCIADDKSALGKGREWDLMRSFRGIVASKIKSKVASPA